MSRNKSITIPLTIVLSVVVTAAGLMYAAGGKTQQITQNTTDITKIDQKFDRKVSNLEQRHKDDMKEIKANLQKILDHILKEKQ